MPVDSVWRLARYVSRVLYQVSWEEFKKSERPAGWLSDRELEGVAPADKFAFRSPVPTRIVSNGEYNPPPQTKKQRQVEGLTKEYSDKLS